MRLTTTTHVSLDGVLQGMGDTHEDRRDGFTRGGWAVGVADPEIGARVVEVYAGAAAFLLGRRTHDIFAASWGRIADAAAHPIAGPLHARPRYVATSTPPTTSWPGSTALTGDLAAAVRDLRAHGDGVLLVPGSGVLVRWLLAHDLVDEVELLIHPVVVGQGTRLFPQEGPDLALDLVDSRTTARGSTIQTYRPAGRPRYAGAADA